MGFNSITPYQGPVSFTSNSSVTSGSGSGTSSMPNGLSQTQIPGQNLLSALQNVVQTVLPALEHGSLDTQTLSSLFKQLESALQGAGGSSGQVSSGTGRTSQTSSSTGGTSQASSNTGGTTQTSSGTTQMPSATTNLTHTTHGTGMSTHTSTGTGNNTQLSTGTGGPARSGGTQAQFTKEPSDDPNAIQQGILQDFQHTTQPSPSALSAISNASAQPSFQSAQSGPATSFRSPSGSTSIWGDGTLQTGPSSATSVSTAELASQGPGAGDCYALASWSAYAQANPQAAKDMVRPDPDGKPGDYQVNLNYKDPQTGAAKSEWVSVDDKFPMFENPPASGNYASAVAGLPKDGSGNTILGPALIEKAFAKFNDAHQVTQGANQNPPLTGYAGINGGAGPEALYAFTGKDSSTILAGQGKTFSQSGTSKDNVLQVLSAANNGQPVMTASLSQDEQPNGQPTFDKNGVTPSHQYTVLGTGKDAQGNTTVTLRNPWGNSARVNGDAGNGNNGVFTLTLDQYMQSFGQASMGS